MLVWLEKQTALSLQDRLARATEITPELFSTVAAAVGVGVRPVPQRLLEAEAWTDAALALIDAALPHWKVTRLAFDDGEWFCRISKHWQLPDWLDDVVEARHEVLALAILSALIEAYQMGERPAVSRTVPRVQARFASMTKAALCDNFM
jgi:hypothetical protein